MAKAPEERARQRAARTHPRRAGAPEWKGHTDAKRDETTEDEDTQSADGQKGGRDGSTLRVLARAVRGGIHEE